MPLAQTHGVPRADEVLTEISELVSIPKAHAQSTLGNTASRFFGGALEICTVLNWILLGMVQAVLNPDFIFGDVMYQGVRPMEPILRKIWMISRDIVNAIFAFLLIIGAIMVILQGKMEMLKQKAPMFVLAVILVNFSWFFPRVILDMANVLQSVVYQIPQLVDSSSPCIYEIDPGDDGTLGTNDDKPQKCNFVWKVRIFPTMCDGACPPRPTKGGQFPKRGRQIGNIVDIYYTDWGSVRRDGGYRFDGRFYPVSGADVVVNGLAVNFARLPNLARVDFEIARMNAARRQGPMEKAGAYVMFFVHLAFNAIISIAIGLLLLAILGVFIVRVGVIWLCVAFMPFVFLGLAMRGSFGSLGEIPGAEFNIWKTFLKYAFLPALVAVPLAIGFTLLSQAPAVAWISQNPGPYKIEGMPKVLGTNTFHELMWLAVTLGVLWIGTFKVLEKSDQFAQKFVGGVKSFGQGAMKFGYKSLGFAPIIPMPGGGGKMGSLFGGVEALKRGARGRGAWSMGLDFTKDAKPPPGGGNLPTSDQVNQASNHITVDNWKELERILNRSGTREQRVQNASNYLSQQSGGALSQQNVQALLNNASEFRNLADKSVGGKDAALRDRLINQIQNLSAPRGRIGIEYNATTATNDVLRELKKDTVSNEIVAEEVQRMLDQQVNAQIQDLGRQINDKLNELRRTNPGATYKDAVQDM